MSEPEKIRVPGYEADQERAAYRETALGELREWIEDKHQKALDEDLYGQFKFRTPIELLKDLTPQEREKLQDFEQQTYARLKPLAREKADQRQAFVRAGGGAEAFEANWGRHGRDEHIARKAAQNLERARRESSIY